MEEFEIIRGLVLRVAADCTASAPLAQAIRKWAQQHARWLTGKAAGGGRKLGWRALITALGRERPQNGATPHPLALAAVLGEALHFGEADRRLLAIAVAEDRMPRVTALIRAIVDGDGDLPDLMAAVAGCAPHALRRSPVLQLDLIHLRANRAGRIEVAIGWMLERLLDREAASGTDLIEAMIGVLQTARLGLDAFGGHAAETALLVRLLAGALQAGEAGVNILIHGPPGTGKTELARTLADAVGVRLFGVGEVDEDGAEPARWERVAALRMAHRLLAGRNDAMLLFDEMEDMIGSARPDGDWFSGRQGSKVWVNRLLESNAVPVIWTTNAIGNVDPAILRRMSFVLRLDLPSRATGQGMLERIAREEAIALPEALRQLASSAAETPTVARVALRAGRLSGDAADSVQTARSLVTALRGGNPPRSDASADIDLDLYETDLDLSALLDRLASPDAPHDVSLLLTGPPGTGKTELAHHLARRLDRPLLVKLASDLLSKWIGETEDRIAGAFREAERCGGILLFDEVDSVLHDRGNASRSWEVTQVNELLSWLDRHPLPFVAATNHAAKLDPAALRRFVFKLDLRPFGGARAARAFTRFFGREAPASLADIASLAPGDFAVVQRQIRHLGDIGGDAIVARLRAEVAMKSAGGGRIGF